MDIFNEFGTDEAKEVDGVWQKIGVDAEILVARAGNRKYTKAFSELWERHQRELDKKNDEAERLAEEIMTDVMARTILIGWRRKEGGEVKNSLKFKGQELAYSPANAKTLLSVKDFRNLVSKLAGDFDAYRVKVEAEQGKS